MAAMMDDATYAMGGTGSSHGFEGTGLPEGFETLDSHVRNAVVHPRLTDEEKFANKVAFKRSQEMERRARIFDAKRRTIGVDKEMLDQQVMENRMKKAMEKANIKADDGMMRQCDKMLKLMETDKTNKQRQSEKHCKDFSLQNLHFAARREYDLNDPLAIRKEMPGRIGDDDPRCGVSSFQQFNGEDLLKEERIRQQRAQQVNFIEQQKFEKSMLAQANKGDGAAHAREVAEITALRNEMEENEHALRRELKCGQQGDNLDAAYDKIQGKWQQKEEEHMRNQEELDFHATDPFLNEHGQVILPSGTVEKRTTYKGSTREERVDVFKTHMDQCEENAGNRMMTGYEDRVHNANNEACRKHLVATERQKGLERRKQAMQIAQENRQLHLQQHEKTKETNQTYTNKYGQEFFEQFGTHSR